MDSQISHIHDTSCRRCIPVDSWLNLGWRNQIMRAIIAFYSTDSTPCLHSELTKAIASATTAPLSIIGEAVHDFTSFGMLRHVSGKLALK